MYAGYFGLQTDPFSIAPDPHYLYMSERHREALAHLLYGLQGSGGIVLLTGDIGTGKTTVFRCFLEQVPGTCQVAYIFNPKLSVTELLRVICDEFGVPVHAAGPGPATVKDHIDPLNAFLLGLHAQGRQAVLVIDEAQNLSADVLEQLRLLTNLETAERKLLQIVLIGQPELRDLLAQPALEQLSQRVVARYHLEALSEPDTLAYVRHRLSVAGLQGPQPMGERVLRRIHRLSRGVPRRINLLCDRVLLGAYGRQQDRIDTGMVDRAAREVFGHGPAAGWRRWLPWGLAGVLALGAAAAAGAWWQARQGTPGTEAAAPSPVPAPAQDAPAEQAPAHAPTADTGAPEPGGPDELRAASLWTAEAPAWQALAPLWGADLGDTAGDPCTQALAQGLQCFRTPRMTLDGLTRLNRPAILTLRLPGKGVQRALLIARTDDGHYLLGHEDQRWRIPAEALTAVWEGGYATLWRTPPGTRARIADARLPEQRAWIDARLRQLQAQGRIGAGAGAKSYDARLKAFQAATGVEVHGQASPMTLMQLNQATGVDEPRLLASPLTADDAS